MRNLKLTDITTSVGMPLKAGSLTHIQLAYKEVIDAMIKGAISDAYSSSTAYRIYGCVNSTSPAFTISAGAIYYNGEIYLVDATTFTPSVGQTAVCNIVTTYYTGTEADQVEFTDNVSRNVHEIKKIVITAGASGSGLFDFNNIKNVISTLSEVTITNSSKIEVTAGTVTLNFLKLKFQKVGCITHLFYDASINISAYASGSVTFGITFENNLPQPKTIYAGVQNIAAISNYLFNDTITPVQIVVNDPFYTITNFLSTTIKGTTTGTKLFAGQLFYHCQ